MIALKQIIYKIIVHNHRLESIVLMALLTKSQLFLFRALPLVPFHINTIFMGVLPTKLKLSVPI